MMQVAKESLKLRICPVCKKTKGIINILTAEPIYQCHDCNVEWGFDFGIQDMNRIRKEITIKPCEPITLNFKIHESIGAVIYNTNCIEKLKLIAEKS